MPKNIILCFDGTNGDPGDARQQISLLGTDMDDNGITNVLKLHLLFGGHLKTLDKKSPERGKTKFDNQMSFYYSGVGTYGGLYSRLKNAAFCPVNEDVGTIIRKAVSDIYFHCEPEDEIFVFGYSRGAAIARRFASVLADKLRLLGKNWEPKIRFLGVFDTVAAMNKPNLMNEKIRPDSDVVFENNTISPSIKEALHLVALDEKRISFYPTLMNAEDRVTEIWFPGSHADVGGGLYYDGLSDLSLQFMLDWFDEKDLGLLVLNLDDIDYDNITSDPEILIERSDIIVQPNYLGRGHYQESFTFITGAFLCSRVLRVNMDDSHSVKEPILHRSVLDRILDDETYRPEPLLRKNREHPYIEEVVRHKIFGMEESFESLEQYLEVGGGEPMQLEVGEKHTCKVYANQLFSKTGLLVNAGERYRFEVDLNQTWFDLNISCGPDGWEAESQGFGFFKRFVVRRAEDQRRDPSAKWMELLCSVDRRDDGLVQVLQHQEEEEAWLSTLNGMLYAFPNDLVGKYANNLGAIEFTIVRVS